MQMLANIAYHGRRIASNGRLRQTSTSSAKAPAGPRLVFMAELRFPSAFVLRLPAFGLSRFDQKIWRSPAPRNQEDCRDGVTQVLPNELSDASGPRVRIGN
jgi:hypothetical protein